MHTLLNKKCNRNKMQTNVKIILDESIITARKKWKLAIIKKISNQQKVATMELNLDEQ